MATFYKLIIVILISIVVSNKIQVIHGSGEPSVEIANVWGTVTIPAGNSGSTKEEFTCVARNVNSHGKFVWRIGNRFMENTNQVQDTTSDGETVREQTYVINPKEIDNPIETLNNKKLSCSYVQMDSQGSEQTFAGSNSVNLEVKVQDVAQKNVTVPNLQVGAPANLSLKMEIFPAPKNEDYEWTIHDKSTNTKIQVKPDVPNNAEPGYTAEIKPLGGIQYEAVLMIKSVPQEIESKTIYLSVKENTGSSEDAEESSGSSKIYFDVSVGPTTNQMNIGIWIILAVIVVIIIICIVYCIYNGNCCKKKNEKEYEPTPTNDVENNGTR